MSSKRPAPRPAAESRTPSQRVASWIDYSSEFLIYVLLVLSPWLVGGYLPQHLIWEAAIIGAVMLLWSVKQIVLWKLTLYRCVVSLLIVVVFITSILAIIPLPKSALRSISPSTVKLYDDLLPTTRETSSEGELQEDLPFQPGTTLSLFPGATQDKLHELLAVFMLFLVVRHSLASPGSLKRLSYVLIINGCALAIFGLIQKVRSPATDVYGITVAGAQVFGPFINRNHFASYVNFSICMGLGLFLASLGRIQSSTPTYQVRRGPASASGTYAWNSWGEILQHPLAVWLLLPIAVCITAVMASLSRGGILALGVGIAVTLLAQRRRSIAFLVPVVLLMMVAGGFLLWYGVEPTIERLDQEHLVGEGRFSIWKGCWELARRFPWVGTGLGTFFVVEPITRQPEMDQSSTILHAHNEYLEALVEGGVIRLLLTLALVYFVLWYGWRAATGRRHSGEAAVAAGALGACSAFAIQSIGEFGIHLPALAATLTVVAAHLTALGTAGDSSDERGSAIEWNFLGVGPLLHLAVSLSLVLALLVGVWRLMVSEAYRVEAFRLANPRATAQEVQKAVDALDYAIRFTPGHQRLRLERCDLFTLMLDRWQTEQLLAYERTWLWKFVGRWALAPFRSFGEPTCAAIDSVFSPPLEFAAFALELQQRRQSRWKDQQRHLIAARDLCPVSWRAQLDIAQHVMPQKTKVPIADSYQYWKESDDLARYLNRVKTLQPHRAETWYLCGNREGLDGNREEAIKSWRRSLELSDDFLEPIMRGSTNPLLQPELKLETPEIMEKLIPANKPGQLIKTAWLLYPKVTEINQRRPFMESALAKLEQDKKVLDPVNQHLYGLALWGVTKREQALQHIQDALRRTPRNISWRVDLARLQFELHQFADCREQLGLILQAEHNNIEAREMLERLDQLQRPQENKRE